MSSETSNKQLIQFKGMLVVVSYLFGAALQDADVIESSFVSLSIGEFYSCCHTFLGL